MNMLSLNAPQAFVAVFVIAIGCSARATARMTKKQPQTPFLKEILMGRCYDRPPTGVVGDTSICQSLVGEIMSVIEGRLDSNVRAVDFKPYLDKVDMSSPPNQAVFWPSLDTHAKAAIGGDMLVPVERTPGGWLLSGLVFCGIDMREECPLEYGAYRAFWAAATAAYAASASGRIRAVLLGAREDGSSDFLIDVVPNINPDSVSGFDIYVVGDVASCDGDSGVAAFMVALSAHGIKDVTCTSDKPDLFHVKLLIMCTDEGESALCRCFDETKEVTSDVQKTHSISEQKQDTPSNPEASDHLHPGIILLIVVATLGSIVAFVVWTHRTWAYEEVSDAALQPTQ